jgi:hypothetical protein
LRSRRHTIALSIAAALLVGAAAPFSPRVYWRARVAWAARGLESANEAERWKARLALLEMPRELIEHELPRIVASAVAEDARHGDLVFVERVDEHEPVFPANASRPSVRGVYSVSYLGEMPAPDQVRELLRANVDPRVPRLVTYHVDRGEDGQVVFSFKSIEAPLDAEGETLRLLRERLPR